jgi:hypothetical protein
VVIRNSYVLRILTSSFFTQRLALPAAAGK